LTLRKPAYEQLLRAHQGAVRAFLCRLCGSHALADDLAQDCFIKAYKNYNQLKSAAAAQFWLFGIAYRCFLDHARKEKRRKSLRETEPAPLQAAALETSRLDLEAAMDNLAPDCRACVILCLAHGYTQEDAAQMTGLPVGTVKSHIHRGKLRLKAFLAVYEKVD